MTYKSKRSQEKKKRERKKRETETKPHNNLDSTSHIIHTYTHTHIIYKQRNNNNNNNNKMYNDFSLSLTMSEAGGPESKNTISYIAKDFDKPETIKKHSKKKQDPLDSRILWHIAVGKEDKYLSVSIGICNPNRESTKILKEVNEESTSVSPSNKSSLLPEGWKLNREVTITLVHPTEPSKAITRSKKTNKQTK